MQKSASIQPRTNPLKFAAEAAADEEVEVSLKNCADEDSGVPPSTAKSEEGIRTSGAGQDKGGIARCEGALFSL